MTLQVTSNNFNPNGYWDIPIDSDYIPTIKDVSLFDQNGYDLCDIEKKYSLANHSTIEKHREHRNAIKQDWIVQDDTITGAHLNHSLLFERKAYRGEALQQLKKLSKDLPLLNKIIAMRPKWGLDFSMDYVDEEGNSFEVLHWEWDSFHYDLVTDLRIRMQEKLIKIDWDDAAKTLLRKKEEWHSLTFFEQSDYKCDFFNIPREQFKMVIWE